MSDPARSALDTLLKPLLLLRAMLPLERSARLRLTMAFGVLLFGALWITFSDALGTAMFPTLGGYEKYQTVKGLLFIVMTALFVDLLLARHARRIAHLERDAAGHLARLRAALKASGAAVWEFQPDPGGGSPHLGRIHGGENVGEMFGLDDASRSFSLQDCLGWLTPADAAIVEQTAEDCLAGRRQSFDVTVRLRRSGGDGRPLRLVGRPASHEQDPAYRAWVGVAIDLSESTALAERANLLELLFSNAPDALAILDPALQLRAANKAFKRMCGDAAKPGYLEITTVDGESLEQLLPRVMKQGAWRGRLRLPDQARPRSARMLAVRPRGGVAASVVLTIHSEMPIEGIPAADGGLPRISTPLIGREEFETQLRFAIENGDIPCAAVVFRFDGLPEINDVYGLTHGDQVIRQLAGRFAELEAVRATRLSGAKFAVLLEQPPPRERLGDWLGVTAAKLSASLPVDQDEWKPHVRIGVAYAQAGQTASELIHAAESAARQHLYALNDPYTVYDPQLTASAREELSTVQAISRGLDQGEFDCVFQPQLDLHSGRLCGAEALLRWFRPRGLVLPDEFIPLAEKHGLMEQLGAVALNAALRRTAHWRAGGLVDANFRISVNVSAAQLSDGWEQQILEALDQAGLPGRQLCLELTESLAINHHARVLPALRVLREHGVHIALDDFGTGHSSLLQLRRLPIDQLKIDRSFVEDLAESGESYAMIHAMLSMGQALHLSLVAEGIESREQARLLSQLGCPIGQGYWFRRPVSARGFENFCRHHQPDGTVARFRRIPPTSRQSA